MHQPVADMEFLLRDIDVGEVLHAGHDVSDGVPDLRMLREGAEFDAAPGRCAPQGPRGSSSPAARSPAG